MIAAIRDEEISIKLNFSDDDELHNALLVTKESMRREDCFEVDIKDIWGQGESLSAFFYKRDKNEFIEVCAFVDDTKLICHEVMYRMHRDAVRLMAAKIRELKQLKANIEIASQIKG